MAAKKKTGSVKKTASSPRKTHKTAQKSELQVEMAALLVSALGVIYAIFMYTEFTGIVGGMFKDLSLGLWGQASFFIPLLLICLGVHMAIRGTAFKARNIYIGAFIGICVISAMNHISVDLSGNRNFFESIANSYTFGTLHVGGGVVGWIIGGVLTSMFGPVATWVILVVVLILVVMISTSWSPVKYLLKAIILGFGKLKEAKNKPKPSPVSIRTAEELAEDIKQKQEELKEDIYNVFDDDVIFDRSSIIKKIKEDTKISDIVHELKEKSVDLEDSQINIYTNPKTTENGQVVFPVPEAKGLTAEKDSAESADKSNPIDESMGMSVDLENSGAFVPEGLKQYERIDYTFPPLDFLGYVKSSEDPAKSKADLKNTAQKLVDTLKSFGVEVKLLQVSKGPAVTRYELQPSAGVKVSKIVNLADDIALNLAATGVRIEAPIPGKSAIGIEVPNKEVAAVALREVIDTPEFKKHKSNLAFGIGKDISGNAVIADISKMPHVLIAGATGSGKSVCINTLITSILYKSDPNDVKLLMVDPKVVELGIYNGIPHLMIPVVTDPRRAAGALNWAVQEMVMRYKLFADNNTRDIAGYNAAMKDKGIDFKLPHIVIIIDELADLMMVAPNDVEDSICRLAQMARAAGMHLVIATQRPSVDVITGVIKANIPSRISFAVSSQIDSRTILDMAGAEKLLGRGDMLYHPIGNSKPVRLQGSFVSDKEVENIVEFIKEHSSTVTYNEDVMYKIEKNEKVKTGTEEDKEELDPLLSQAIDLVFEAGQGSASYLQRKLKVGFSRASRMIDQMEERGILGPPDGSKPRALITTREHMYDSSHFDEQVAKTDMF